MLRLRDDDVAFLRIVEGHDTSDRDAVGFSGVRGDDKFFKRGTD